MHTCKTTSYIYDDNGNLTSKTVGIVTIKYTFDVWGNMTSDAGADYTYNVQGLRTSKTVGNKTANFTLVGGKVCNDGTYSYFWGLELITNGSVYYLYNAHGDVVQLIDSSGTVIKTYDYDAYGNELTRDLNDPNPFRYCGEYYDIETGFIYLRARYYNPSTGRFISVDPIHDGLNWYAYCNNNPILYVDSSGMKAQKEDLTVYYGDCWDGNEHLDLRYGDLSKGALRELDWINWSDFFLVSESDYESSWRSLAKLLSVGRMEKVLLDMIKHFMGGTGADYSNSVLTEKVKEHTSTISYMQDFANVFNEFVCKYQGDVSAFANSEEFKDELRTADVLLSKYNYYGLDIFSGLTMAIHSWTESQVDLTSFEINNNTYSGILRFTFKDNFGLDVDDIKEYGQYAGFRSWFILQHYDRYAGKYKPFKTVVTIEYPISGSWE